MNKLNRKKGNLAMAEQDKQHSTLLQLDVIAALLFSFTPSNKHDASPEPQVLPTQRVVLMVAG